MSELFENSPHNMRVAKLLRNGHEELAEAVAELGPDEDYKAIQLKRPGCGHNNSLPWAAGMLKAYWGWSAEKTQDYLDTLYTRNLGDVERAVAKVYDSEEHKDKRSKRRREPKWPGTLAGLTDFISPISLDVLKKATPELTDIPPIEALRKLMGANALACLGTTKFNRIALHLFMMRTIDVERDKDLQFVVPNPCKDWFNLTQDGKLSPKAKSNFPNRKKIVVEMDNEPSKSKQVGVINLLAEFAPLKAVVDSGGKSLHAWFDCSSPHGRKQWQRFFHIACRLGADRGMANASQYCRVPNGYRNKEKLQRLLYLDSNLTEASRWNVDGLENEIQILTQNLK